MKTYINLPLMDKTSSGKRKKWSTDGVITYAASLDPVVFVWEKSTNYNGYQGYSGYVSLKYCNLINPQGRPA
jgi:hypothetical protein